MVNRSYLTLAQVVQDAKDHKGGSYKAWGERWAAFPQPNPKGGYFVALPGGWESEGFDYQTLSYFIHERPLVRLGDHYLGLWESPEGIWYLDESVWIKSLRDARMLQRTWEQITIWDVKNQEAI